MKDILIERSKEESSIEDKYDSQKLLHKYIKNLLVISKSSEMRCHF